MLILLEVLRLSDQVDHFGVGALAARTEPPHPPDSPRFPDRGLILTTPPGHVPVLAVQ